MDKVITNFENDNETEIIKTANTAISALTGNADFVFTTQLTETVTSVADYSVKLSLVGKGGRDAKTIKNTSREVLNAKLNELATSVILESSF